MSSRPLVVVCLAVLVSSLCCSTSAAPRSGAGGTEASSSIRFAAGETALVRCTVRNTGPVAGEEVVQLYLRDELASVARPVTELAGFTRVHLEPGESAEVAFEIGPDRLRMLDEQMRWVVEPGTFRVMVGASSKDIRLRGQLAVR